MKLRHWHGVQHLLRRWHVYEAIKKHCSSYFRIYEKGTQRAQLNRMIQAFRDIVIAPHEEQMRSLWVSFQTGSAAEPFPPEAVDFIKREYFDSPKARKLMECYVFNCGNLHQTTTSRNEGSHAAYRSNAKVIPKPAASYRLRRAYKQQWLNRLRSQAANTRNCIPLEIQRIPELKQLIGKVSNFAISQIRSQIIHAKKSGLNSTNSEITDHRNCHIFNRYNLQCFHMVPTDGSPIPLDLISPFWRIDNWDRGMTKADRFADACGRNSRR